VNDHSYCHCNRKQGKNKPLSIVHLVFVKILEYVACKRILQRQKGYVCKFTVGLNSQNQQFLTIIVLQRSFDLRHTVLSIRR